MPSNPKPPHSDAESFDSGDISELRSVLEDLEAEMEDLESSLSALRGPVPEREVDDAAALLEDLDDPENQTRMASRRTLPREERAALYEELGEAEASIPIPGGGVVRDLNPKPNPDRVRPKRQLPPSSPKEPREKIKRVSKREKRKLARENRLVTKQAERAARPRPEAPLCGDDEGMAESEVLVSPRSMDDLDLENPLPEANYAPNRDHSDLIMDRRQRRLESAAIAKLREKGQQEVWDQDSAEADGEGLSGTRRFSLPVYLVLAVLVSLAAFLIFMGLQTAFKSTADAKEGEEEREPEDAPGLKALGVNEAKGVLVSYFEAPGWEKKLQFVRQPKVAGPRMEAYYRANPGEDGAQAGVEILGQTYNSLEGGDAFLLRCRLPDGSSQSVPVVRIPSEAPFYVVDWETLVDYAEQDWGHFLAARRPSSSGVYRLFGVEDDFYAPPFEDSSKYMALLLYDKERTASAHAYVDRSSSQFQELKARLRISESQAAKNWSSGASLLLTSMLKDDNENPQALIDAMNAIEALGEIEEQDDDDLFGDKNLIKPEFWRPQPKVWTPMTLELAFPQAGRSGYLPQLEVVRFVSPNWIIGETKLELVPDQTPEETGITPIN